MSEMMVPPTPGLGRDTSTATTSHASPEEVLARARRRWKYGIEWESTWRKRFVLDVKFANGDSENGYQWPNSQWRAREMDNRPHMTFNLTRQHNLMISNEMRKNKSQVKIIGMGNGATAESASAISQLAKRVESQSNAQDIYTIARNFQVDGGLGFWRLFVDYCDPMSMDQDVYIGPIIDPLAVVLDPDAKRKDGSDARWGFIWNAVARDMYEEEFPEFKEAGRTQLVFEGTLSDDDFFSRDNVMMMEYFEIQTMKDTLISFVDPSSGDRKTILESTLKGAENILEALLKEPRTRTRPTTTEVVMQYKIAGTEIIDETEWIGKYVPIIRCVGEESIIDGVLDRKGHTRWMKDAQRMLNYNASSQVEFVALQSKSPYVAALQAIEGSEQYWNTANTVNHSVLPYNGIDDDGNTIPPPQRQEPPQSSPAFQQGMDTAFQQVMMVSGQWQSQMGMQGNERTGVAIEGRKEQSATATYHFQDNYESALRFTALQLIDIFPKLYDTRRGLLILGDNDEPFEMMIDPAASQAFQQKVAYNGQIIARILNPGIGEYSVAPSVGPAYANAMQQTAESLELILTQNPNMAQIVGDIFMRSLPFDGAQEAAARLRRMVPPQALGQGPSQNEQMLGSQVQSLTRTLSEALQGSAKNELKLVGKDQMRDIDAYEAETKRLGVVKDFMPQDAAGLTALIQQLVTDMLGTALSPIIAANADDIEAETSQEKQSSGTAGGSSPVRGARLAPDGFWYYPNPDSPGKYLRVESKKKSA